MIISLKALILYVIYDVLYQIGGETEPYFNQIYRLLIGVATTKCYINSFEEKSTYY